LNYLQFIDSNSRITERQVFDLIARLSAIVDKNQKMTEEQKKFYADIIKTMFQHNQIMELLESSNESLSLKDFGIKVLTKENKNLQQELTKYTTLEYLITTETLDKYIQKTKKKIKADTNNTPI